MYVAVIITQEINQIREALGRLLSHWLNFKCLQLKITGIFGGVIFQFPILHMNVASWWLRDGKESVCQCRRPGFDSWARKIP